VGRDGHTGELLCLRTLAALFPLAVIEGGADPTIIPNNGTSPTAVAKQAPPSGTTTITGRRECVAELEMSTPAERAPAWLFSQA
jgi:hypothetical protein